MIATPDLPDTHVTIALPRQHSKLDEKRVPIDVVNVIIDELRHDRAALRSCALTAREWLHRSRVHLHRVFTLLHADFTFHSDYAEIRYDVVRKEMPILLQYADELYLKGVDRVLHGDYKRGSPIWSFLPLLRHVRTLHLGNTDLANVSPLCLQNPCSYSWALLFPVLQMLNLSDVSFRYRHNALVLAQNFRGLRFFSAENIRVDNVQFASPPSTPVAFTPRSIRVLDCCDVQWFIPTLTTHLEESEEAREKLERLRIDSNLSADTTSYLQNTLKIVGDGLSELHLSLQEKYQPTQILSNMRAAYIRKGKECCQPRSVPPLTSSQRCCALRNARTCRCSIYLCNETA